VEHSFFPTSTPQTGDLEERAAARGARATAITTVGRDPINIAFRIKNETSTWIGPIVTVGKAVEYCFPPFAVRAKRQFEDNTTSVARAAPREATTFSRSVYVARLVEKLG
jgi:hypothetical protein